MTLFRIRFAIWINRFQWRWKTFFQSLAVVLWRLEELNVDAAKSAKKLISLAFVPQSEKPSLPVWKCSVRNWKMDKLVITSVYCCAVWIKPLSSAEWFWLNQAQLCLTQNSRPRFTF